MRIEQSTRVGGSGLLALVATYGIGRQAYGLFVPTFQHGFALVVMWSQQVFHDRPTTGFTLVIAFVAIGFIIGPSLFGVLATSFDRSVALAAAAVPALLVALVPPSRDNGVESPDA